jgi:hypothetical protein
MSEHKIRTGQVYESCQPIASMPGEHYTRIRVIAEPVGMHGRYGFGKVQVATITGDGREVRSRAIEVTQLHASGTTRDGSPRRTGYRLVKDGE